jgi:outer membrane protein
MKKAILLSLLFVACVFTASAQKFALIDMEYILKNIPAYEQANTQPIDAPYIWIDLSGS